MSAARAIPSPEQQPNDPSSEGERVDHFTEVIRTIFDSLSNRERDEVLRKITEIVRPIPAPRAGDVLEAVVLFLPNRQKWTVDEIKKEVVNDGVTATPKEIYNAIGYLTRKGFLRRVGYGQYIVLGTGAGIQFDGPEDNTVRSSEHF